MPPTLQFIHAPEDEARLLTLGATTTDVGQGADPSRVVMADPEGTEFDVLRSLAPRENQDAFTGTVVNTS